MKKLQPYHALFAVSLAAAGAAQADHNSIWGEGTANMPNDIHNTRIDTMDDDTDSFVDFVRSGAGADSVNRFVTDTDASDGSAAGGQGGGSGRS